jgi:hypothetical protein
MAGRNYNLLIGNKAFKNLAGKFKYLGKTITNQNDITEETKGVLNLGNACHHPVQNILFSRLPKTETSKYYIYIYIFVLNQGG